MKLTAVTSKPEIRVWFSCGAASAVAAYETLRRFGSTHRVRIINNPIAEEHPDNWRFLLDCQQFFGHRIEFAVNEKYPRCSATEIFDEAKYMSGVHGAPCTGKLKRDARTQWEDRNTVDHGRDGNMVLGFTADVQKRHDMFVLTERNNVIPVLIEAGYTKQDCINIVASWGIALPAMYSLGFPNANCIGCVKATSPTYWNHVRKHFPVVFWNLAMQSSRLGVRLVRYKGERIFLHQLPEDAVGRPLASLVMPECGIFCEEYQR